MNHTSAKKTDGVEAASWIQTLTSGKQEGPLSLYFHLPFCRKKCPYCHFYSILDNEEQKSALYDALLKEISFYAPIIHNHEIVSIYFGGGTPYLFGSKRLQGLLKAIGSITHTCEITLEANPEQVTLDELSALFSIGINRLSFGIQSFHESELLLLQRSHAPDSFSKAMHYAEQAGFHNISMDLMYDLPDQTIEGWNETLKKALSFPITHLSLYNLTIEPNTPFYRKKEALLARMPQPDDSLLLYQHAIDLLRDNGFLQYEISAFAKAGARSLHNIGYWTARPYLGFGPSASSFYSLIRYMNRSHLPAYIEALSEGRLLFDSVEQVSKIDRFKELLAVGLRYFDGVSLSLLQQKIGCDIPIETQDMLTRLEKDGLLLRTPVIQLTERGRLVYDSIASELI